MAEILLGIFILFYLVIGIALSIGTDYPALTAVFWFPILIIKIGVETVEFVKDRFEEIQEWLEEKSKKMGE